MHDQTITIHYADFSGVALSQEGARVIHLEHRLLAIANLLLEAEAYCEAKQPMAALNFIGKAQRLALVN